MAAIYIVSVVLLVSLKFSLELSCKDEDNNDVDWFIVYKLPKRTESGETKGTAYAFITSSHQKEWTLSSHKITSKDSILGVTWQNLKDNEKKASYLFYNDHPPDFAESTSVGHLKGFLGFDDKSGFWLTHSIPKFGELEKYRYPKNAITNGQHALCLTFNATELEKICNHLLFCHPNIYLKKKAEKIELLLDEDERSLFAKKPNFINSPPFVKTTKFSKVGKETLLGFAKDNQYTKDMYSEILAPSLNTSLIANTWRRGRGTFLKAFCEKDHTVTDISTMEMKAKKDGKMHTFVFSSINDHSKWAVSTDSKARWTCFSDLNRMKSQYRRGGGALCISSKSVWKLFRGLVKDSSQCPV